MSDSRNLVNNISSNRIQWIDFAKGIGMLLMIFAHCLGEGLLGEAVRGAIFSFHMPLFFCLSAITFRFSENIDEWKLKTKRAFKHLIIPALIMYLHIVVAELLIGKGSEPQFFIKKLLCLLFANGVWYDLKNITVPEIGVIWFLFALFFGRSIYDLLRCTLKRKVFYPVVFALSIIAMIVGQYVYLPFSLDVAIAVFPFFLLGEHFSEIIPNYNPKPTTDNLPPTTSVSPSSVPSAYGSTASGSTSTRSPSSRLLSTKNYKLITILSCILVWIATMVLSFIINHSYFELACRRYTLFPLCYLGAASGIILIYYFSAFICNLPHSKSTQLRTPNSEFRTDSPAPNTYHLTPNISSSTPSAPSYIPSTTYDSQPASSARPTPNLELRTDSPSPNTYHLTPNTSCSSPSSPRLLTTSPTNNSQLINLFQYLGKNSLTLLCVHAMDFVWSFAWKLPVNEFICAFLRIVIDILIFYVVMQIKKGVKQLKKA